jgi:hypothetical protein
MRIYALIENGAVYEIIQPWTDNGVPVDLPIEERYPPEVVAKMVEITDMDPMPQERWTYEDGVFAAPVVNQPTPEEIVQQNTARQNSLIYMASLAMTPVMVSLQLGDATDEETVRAKAWQTYYRDLKLVELSIAAPTWPVSPE